MASTSDVLRDLGKRPLGYKLGVLAGVMVLLCGIYWQLFYTGLVEQQDQLKSERRSLQTQSLQLDKDMASMDELELQNRKLDEDIQRIQQALPQEAERTAFIEHLQQKAGDSGVVFKKWTNQKEANVGKYIKVPMVVEIEGSYLQILNYFYLLAPKAVGSSDDQSVKRPVQRIVTVEDLSMDAQPARNDGVIIKVTFTAATFRQEGPESSIALPPAPAAAKPAAGGQSGAKPSVGPPTED